ncbi:carbohydrate-binding module family 18 [Hyaloscypha variabilis F]|uniref:Carbohydrate-binding module family 18 n=1 Tax=Hyaloscypha variabilis (strain UAMH 11265 / GT02V1 / F) TaxID=1149755 RepID=A0A2J6R059_HYAVF|nr:carbohydrate-binding module family 18 [Hyaloscypha variabilis F]
MDLFQSQPRLPNCLFLAVFFLFLITAIADEETGICKPITWSATDLRRPKSTPTVWERNKKSLSVANIGKAETGQVNCRYPGGTCDDVDSCTCAQLAHKYQITLKKFFMLNPELDPDCGNIEPRTDYCVAGFIEPLRAFDGLCGPPNKNATCLGTAKQCCNAETWTCGDSPEDCAPGTCYEGACPGDKLYSTDGTCGIRDDSLRMCAGKWGGCCNMDGVCGTGPEFCSMCMCSMGNCTRPNIVPAQPLYMLGNTTDGTCGGKNNITCNVVYGNCCNKDGICGQDCGEGW